MLVYGFAKIFRLQFSDLSPFELRTTVGEIRPVRPTPRPRRPRRPSAAAASSCEMMRGSSS
jgi:hypothetical protein